MSSPAHRVQGVRILKAVSSPIRLQILNLLFDRGPLSYTELMSSLKMNPSRDAGRFAYHLKFLLKADLTEADVESRKYLLTDLGKTVIDVADKIERRAMKSKSLLVRTSKFTLEEFDANKIAHSLTKEAKMPADLAQRVAKEAERRLLKSKTKYLTAPLVREVVNALLIEKGLEEYRHKLTRLGIPVHDVAALIEAQGNTRAHSIQEAAGGAVLEEYVLLNVLPRDIADAHISGGLHINNLSSWALKPSEAMHDLRFFLQNGLNLETAGTSGSSISQPQNLESALTLIMDVLLDSEKEVAQAQTLDYFNVFLAPFAKGVEQSRIREALRTFISSVSQHTRATLGLELAVPDFIAGKQAVGPSGKSVGKYGDFEEETKRLASLTIETLAEQNASKPVLSVGTVVKMREKTVTDETTRNILLKAHQLAAERGVVYFACLPEKNWRHSVFSVSGVRLGGDWNGDWEIDTLRTGLLGSVGVDLPRVAYECEKDRAKFFELLRERLEMASRALEIKERALKQHGKTVLPFLLQSVNGDQYFRLEDAARVINLIGLKEAAEAFSGKNLCEDEATLKFAEEITRYAADFAGRAGKRRGKRLLVAAVPDSEASERLAQLDVERYGIAKVRFSGTREKPFYSTVNRIALKEGKLPQEASTTNGKLWDAFAGGSLTVVELGESDYKPEELLGVTKQLVENGVDFFVYARKLTYCANCKRSWFGLLHKCPSCGAVGTLRLFEPYARV